MKEVLKLKVKRPEGVRYPKDPTYLQHIFKRKIVKR